MSSPSTVPTRASRVPGTLVILTAILCLCALATFFVPRGAYDRVERQLGALVPHTIADGEDLAQVAHAAGAPADLALVDVLDAATLRPVDQLVVGAAVLVRRPGPVRSAIVPGSYRSLDEAEPRSFGAKVGVAARSVVLAPLRGFVDRAEVIGFVLLIGAAFGVLLSTGAIDRALGRAVSVIGAGRLRVLVVPAIMVLFSLGGAILGMGESTIAFVLITIPLAILLGYDTFTGIAMCYMASQVGFAGAFFNPFTIGIAQSIAELPYLSGLWFRVVTWVVVTSIAVAWVMWWAERVRADPRRTPTYELDELWRQRLGAQHLGAQGADTSAPLSTRDIGVLLATLSTLVVSGIGVAVWDWYIGEMAALFVTAGLLGGVCAGYRPDRIAKEFIAGAASMIEPALVIALAAGVLRVLEDGQVLDTVLMALAAPLHDLPGSLAAVLLMAGQAVINFFVPSGSGQAALTMPVTTPLCDILGLDRQVGALAFQFGDGFGNMVIPTSAVLMGVLGAAKVSWVVWLRWVWKFVLALQIVAAIMLVIAVLGPSDWMR